MYGCESWTIKKAEGHRIVAFKLSCRRKLLRVPWTARSSNQSIIKEISPEYSLEGQTLNLKVQNLATWCEDMTHWKRPWSWERLNTGGAWDDRGWDVWMASPTQQTWVWRNSGRWWRTWKAAVLHSMGSQRVIHDWDWTTTTATTFLEQFLRVIWGAISWATVLILSQMKHNSQFSHFVSVLVYKDKGRTDHLRAKET